MRFIATLARACSRRYRVPVIAASFHANRQPSAIRSSRADHRLRIRSSPGPPGFAGHPPPATAWHQQFRHRRAHQPIPAAPGRFRFPVSRHHCFSSAFAPGPFGNSVTAPFGPFGTGPPGVGTGVTGGPGTVYSIRRHVYSIAHRFHAGSALRRHIPFDPPPAAIGIGQPTTAFQPAIASV